MALSKKQQFDRIVLVAIRFRNSSRVLLEQQENTKYSVGVINGLTRYAAKIDDDTFGTEIVSLSFSIELTLKAILLATKGNYRRGRNGHDIKLLINDLPENDRALLFAEWQTRFEGTTTEEVFNNLNEEIKDSFQVWRYLFDNGDETKFAMSHALALMESLLSLIPYYSSRI